MNIPLGAYSITVASPIYKIGTTLLEGRRTRHWIQFINGKEIGIIQEENKIIGIETEMEVEIDVEKKTISIS